MEEDKHSLFQPLIPLSGSSSSSTATFTTATSSSSSSSYSSLHDYNSNDPSKCNSKPFISNRNILLRILLVLVVAAISIWANLEASRTFDVIIVNEDRDSVVGRRFDIYYVSNDKASRIVLNTSSFVEHFLYPNDGANTNNYNNKKHIESITLRLSRRNLNTSAVNGCENIKGNYVINISPMLLEGEDYHEKNDNMAHVTCAIMRVMAKVWLWDGSSKAPMGLLDGMAEFVTQLAGFRADAAGGGGLPECEGRRGRWWEDEDPRHVARYLQFYENYKEGFIRRLNEAMRDTWHDWMVDDALGIPPLNICALYNTSVGETRFV